MNHTVTRPTGSRKWFVRVCIGTMVVLVGGIAGCASVTLRWWQAIDHVRESSARLTLAYVGPAWVPQRCRFLPVFMDVRNIYRFRSMSDAELQSLNRIGKVGNLWLHQSNLSDRQIKMISDLRVRIMHVECNEITDLGAKCLSKMTSLEELYLDENPVTDASLLSLRSLPRLKKLSVSKTSITTRAVREFAGDTSVEVICLPR